MDPRELARKLREKLLGPSVGVTPAVLASQIQSHVPATVSRVDLPEADLYIVSFSGGKDSTALFLHLLELGVPEWKIELWHQMIDPPDRPFMDWPVTPAYCRAFAEAFGVPLYFQAKEGGFEGEMLRDNTPGQPTSMETPSGRVIRTAPSTVAARRMEFPKKTADLSQRWCSAALKIDVASKVFTNDPRFASGRFVILTGERGEESTARGRYEIFESHRSTAPTKNRFVFQWRPIRDWPEVDVWAIMERWGVNPHPAYKIGFGRVSCMSCIFGGPGQWAEIQKFAPKHFEKIADYEEQLGRTITQGKTVREMAAIAHRPEPPEARFKTGARAGQIKPRPEGTRMFVPPGMAAAAEHWMTTSVYDEPILLGGTSKLGPGGSGRGVVRASRSGRSARSSQVWQLPAGAFKKTGGPV